MGCQAQAVYPLTFPAPKVPRTWLTASAAVYFLSLPKHYESLRFWRLSCKCKLGWHILISMKERIRKKAAVKKCQRNTVQVLFVPVSLTQLDLIEYARCLHHISWYEPHHDYISFRIPYSKDSCTYHVTNRVQGMGPCTFSSPFSVPNG